jgi:HAD superfamily hydrolase (TIGR01509 family)
MADVGAIIFDFDGVLLESELELNRLTAELLTEMGHETSLGDALEKFTGLNGRDVLAAIEARIAAVVGSVEFVRSLPPELPKAVASSSSTRWIRSHLDHLSLAGAFGDHIYSGREHVERGKPAPDLYLHAAGRLGVPIADCVIIEDSPVGAKGALASGARVVGLVAGEHCIAGHAERLATLGVREIAGSFDEVRRMLRLG